MIWGVSVGKKLSTVASGKLQVSQEPQIEEPIRKGHSVSKVGGGSVAVH